MKEAGFEHWSWPNEGGINESAYTALPAGRGYFPIVGNYWEMSHRSYFWINSGFSLKLCSELSSVEMVSFANNPHYGLSVNCVGD